MLGEKSRNITFGYLELRKLTASDLTILFIYAAAVAVQYYMSVFWPSKTGIGLFVISILVSAETVSSPIGLRFRNIYFSIIWFICSLLFTANQYSLANLPLFTFLLYHIIRLIFWRLYNKEFIPFTTGRGAMYRYYSKIEGRSGGVKDKRAMKILIALGITLFFYCLYGMIGLHL